MNWKRWTKLIAIPAAAELLLAAGIGYGMIACAQHRADKVIKGSAQVSKADPDRTYRLKRADLILGLRLGGSVSASKKHKLSLQANYSTKLLSIVDENTKVKAGDVLAVFETDALRVEVLMMDGKRIENVRVTDLREDKDSDSDKNNDED